LAQSLQSVIDAPIIELDTIDSTNNYAMALVDADTAQPGLTVTALEQTAGKGQRGRKWEASNGQSLSMSIILEPNRDIQNQFLFNVSISLAIAEILEALYEGWKINVKWPNDIIVNDKKAGGVLIENVIGGSTWKYSVVGLGLNVQQQVMPEMLPHASSLYIASRKVFEISRLVRALREQMITNVYSNLPADELMMHYNNLLFRKGEMQRFEENGNVWQAEIQAASTDGKLIVRENSGEIKHYNHGKENWQW
jgi:BirA family biotin operon repressor/biotin-[acetyl-CoA-carboxylase] ligase